MYRKILSSIWPPFRHELRREELQVFILRLISHLPDEFYFLREQYKVAKVFGLQNWILYPGYMFVSNAYPGNYIKKNKHSKENLRIYGMQIFSFESKKNENIELLVQRGELVGIKISNGEYEPSEFDLDRIDLSALESEPFFFEPDEIEIFLESLDSEIRKRLKEDEIFDIEVDGCDYFAFYDLDDGNYLATDKKQRVFSLVHGARPTIKRLNPSFLEILIELENNDFNTEKHLDERYSNSK